jgi:hypothetical protein
MTRDDTRSGPPHAVTSETKPAERQTEESRSVDVGRRRSRPHCFGQRGIRCPLLRPDSAQKDRLVAIRANLVERIAEARDRAWLGEVEGLEATLVAADQKLAAMDALAARKQIVRIGMPTIATIASAPRP